MIERQARKQALTARRQDQILAAALEIFLHKGYTAATIPEIARRAGLAAGTIYLYFPNKRELFIKVVENLVVTPLLAIFQEVTDDNFGTTMLSALENRLAFFQSGSLSRLLLLMSEIQRDPELKNSFNQMLMQPLFKRMGGIFSTQIENGVFRSMDPEIIPRLVGSMMIGLAMMQNIEGDSSPFRKMDLKQMSAEIMNFVMFGVIRQSDQYDPREDNHA